MAAERSGQPPERKGLLHDLMKSGVTALAGGVVGLFLGALSPIGDWAEERVESIIGTDKVAILGTLHRDGDILADVDVILRHDELGETFNDRTNDAGQYNFSDTREGNLYEMDVLQNDQTMLRGYLIVIPEDVSPYNVDVIDIARVQVIQQEQVRSDAPGEISNLAFQDDRAVAIQDPEDQVFYAGDGETVNDETGIGATPAASPVSAELEPMRLVYDAEPIEGDSGSPAWNVSAEIDAGDSTLEPISVTYYLDPAFQPSVVTRTEGPDFQVSFEADSNFQLGAIVTFNDGTMLELTTYLDLGT